DNSCHYNRKTYELCRWLRHSGGHQQTRNFFRECRTTESASDSADRSNAELDGREKTGGLPAQRQRDARTGISGNRTLLEQGMTGSDDGNLGNCENAVQKEQREYNADFGEKACHGGLEWYDQDQASPACGDAHPEECRMAIRRDNALAPAQSPFRTIVG